MTARNPRHVGLVWFVHAYPGQHEAHWVWEVYEHADTVLDPQVLHRGAANTVEAAGEQMLAALVQHTPTDPHMTARDAIAYLNEYDRRQIASVTIMQDAGRLGFGWTIHTGNNERHDIDDALEGAAE